MNLAGIEPACILVFLVGFEPRQAVGIGEVKLVAIPPSSSYSASIMAKPRPFPNKLHAFDSRDAQHAEPVADHLPDCCPRKSLAAVSLRPVPR
jgi:hypothetical protein